MKKLVMLSLLTSAIFADTYYIDYRAVGYTAPNNDKVMGVQPLKELVGDGGFKNEIAFGHVIDNSMKVGFVGSWIAKEKEWSSGLEFIYKSEVHQIHSISVLPYVRSMIGIGGQMKSGSFQVSTQVNKANYVVTTNVNTLKKPDTAEWEKQPVFFTYSIEGGVDFQLSKNWSMNVGIEFQPKYWNLVYRNDSNKEILNSLSKTQYTYNAKIGLSYKFGFSSP